MDILDKSLLTDGVDSVDGIIGKGSPIRQKTYTKINSQNREALIASAGRHRLSMRIWYTCAVGKTNMRVMTREYTTKNQLIRLVMVCIRPTASKKMRTTRERDNENVHSNRR